ncbi:hypothetical protein [Bradyrhizobium sp. LHD-71]|uniref:hypothetical protein n=1 Tax=Bradyrhizobium sp. LHD-71 TaxID=3072141 RepID=UPI00280D31CB|nr:hypothetical protein [Bradyrhizobium sp. LHD-71]MDQ8731132.1 hypothetical protein [Bradyrhizobium sp. LHD-71]
MLNAARCAAALVLAGATLVLTAPSHAQSLSPRYADGGYTDYYGTTTGPAPRFSGSRYTYTGPYAAATDAYAAVGPVVRQRRFVTTPNWSTGLQAPDWVAIHGSAF